MEKYIALIGDLRGSREIGNRSAAQREIQGALEEIHRRFTPLFVSSLTLTLGDEFQALLKPAPEVPRILDELEYRLQDYPFRIGLGYGGILTEINPNLSIGADGPAYWNAREAINWVHDNSPGGKISIAIRGFGGLRDDLLNALFQAADLIKNKWTGPQRQVFDGMLHEGVYQDRFAQNELARTLGLSASSLSKRLDAGNIKAYLNLRGVIARAIGEWGNEAE